MREKGLIPPSRVMSFRPLGRHVPGPAGCGKTLLRWHPERSFGVRQLAAAFFPASSLASPPARFQNPASELAGGRKAAASCRTPMGKRGWRPRPRRSMGAASPRAVMAEMVARTTAFVVRVLSATSWGNRIRLRGSEGMVAWYTIKHGVYITFARRRRCLRKARGPQDRARYLARELAVGSQSKGKPTVTKAVTSYPYTRRRRDRSTIPEGL
jgi:hypothetical protein